MVDFLRITPRAAAALKPFLDAALRREREGWDGVHPVFHTSEWSELLAAWRESQAVCEGIVDGG